MNQWLTALVLCAFAALPARAQDPYPSRAVRVLVPFAPGSSTDVLGRLLSERLSKSLGQPIVVENRPGAGGMIGTAAGAKAPADGYTLIVVGSGPLGINPAIYKKLAYDPLKDFAPIIGLGYTPQVLVTSSTAPYKTLKEFLQWAKAAERSIDYASIGNGSTSHMAGQLFQSVSNTRMNHIPFKSNADAQLQIVGDSVPVMFDALPGVLPLISSGRLRPLAAASKARSPFAPDIPTFAEQGLPAMQVIGWIGLAAPAGTPVAILDRLNAEGNALLKDPEFLQKLGSVAFSPMGGSRSEFEQYIAAEIKQWSRVAADAGIQLD